MNAVAVEPELSSTAAMVGNICLPAQTPPQFPRKPPPPVGVSFPTGGALKSTCPPNSPPPFQPQPPSDHPHPPLVPRPLSAGRPLHGCFCDASWPPATVTECYLTYVSIRMGKKSRGWFASSATGGAVYNCGAIVEVNVKSIDGTRTLPPLSIPQGAVLRS